MTVHFEISCLKYLFLKYHDFKYFIENDTADRLPERIKNDKAVPLDNHQQIDFVIIPNSKVVSSINKWGDKR